MEIPNKKYYEDMRKKLTEQLDQRNNRMKSSEQTPMPNADSAPFLNQEIHSSHFRNQSSPGPKFQEMVPRELYVKSLENTFLRNDINQQIDNLYNQADDDSESKYTGKFKNSIIEEEP
jgi:hypothetical protein